MVRKNISDHFSTYSIFVLIVASFTGLLFGYHLAVVSGVLHLIQSAFKISTWQVSFLVSILLLGGLFGSLLAGYLVDQIGRKKSLLLLTATFCIGPLILTLSDEFYLFLFGRFLTGFAVGLASVITPMYLAEISPPHYRGRYVALFQLNITLGILLAYIANIFFAHPEKWHSLFTIVLFPTFLQWLAIFFIPESPAWLIRTGKESEALNSLGNLREDKQWREQIPQMEKSAGHTRSSHAFKWVVIVGFLLSIFQQITGINGVIFFAPKIFEKIETFAHIALLATLSIGIVNVVMTLISMNLLDRFGRRRVLLIGTFAMAFFQLILAITNGIGRGFAFNDYLSLIAILGYIAAFAIGLGPITWVVLSEIFPLQIRGKAMMFAIAGNWICNYLVTLTFLSFILNLGPSYTFLLYSLISFLSTLIIYLTLPETKGRTLEQIEEMVRHKKFSPFTK